MAAADVTRAPASGEHDGRSLGSATRRFATETKNSLKTSELWMTVSVVVLILISAMVINGGDTGGSDEFVARQAWLYVAIVAGAYAISRGLAKAGSREPYSSDDGDH
jgi:hypothetical protein